MKQFDEIIKSKVKDFEAPEIVGAWNEFSHFRKQKALIKTKIWISGSVGFVLFALFIGISINNNIFHTNKKDKVINNTIAVNNINSNNLDNISDSNNKKYTSTNNLANNTNVIINIPTSSIVKNEQNYLSENKISTSNTSNTSNNNSVSFEDNNMNESNTTPTNNTTISNDTKNNKSINLNNISASYNIIEVCLPAKVQYSVVGVPESYKFCWILSSKEKIYGKDNFEKIYNESGHYSPILEVFDSEGNVIKRIYLNEFTIYSSPIAKINFENTNNNYIFSSQSHNAASTVWIIDNQVFDKSSLEYNFIKEGNYFIKLIVKNEAGCVDEATKIIDVNIEHDYFMPTAFRPYSDGINANFGPIGENLHEYSFKMLIFDKTGSLIFETTSFDKLWNGKINGTGAMAEPGVYTWEVLTIDKYGIKKHKKGQVTLLKN